MLERPPRAAAGAPREATIARHYLRAAVAALLVLAPAAGPALGQQGARPRGAQGAGGQDRGAPEKPAAPAVIGCPSLANYRALLGRGAAAAAATLADPRADHLGCVALPRARITGTTDRVTLGGASYACVGVQGTATCHWVEASAAPDATTGAAGGR